MPPRIKPQSAYAKLMDEMNIDETYTKPIKKYKFDTIKQNTFPKQDYNFMMDTMQLPTTKEGFQHLLVVVDLWSDELDFEPLKGLTALETLHAFETIIKRPYLKMPKFSIRSDNGTEFMKEFGEYMKEHHIMHRVSLPYRHKQNANVENANGLIGRFLMTYLHNKELQTQQKYVEWTDILPQLRIKLNAIRKKKDGNPFNLKPISYIIQTPLYKVGDIVVAKYEKPFNALGHKESTSNWRRGDQRWNLKDHRSIVKVLNYPNNIRYVLKGLENVSYVESELKLSPEKQELRIVKQIIGVVTQGRKKLYRIWFDKQLKKDALWYKQEDLPDLVEEIKEFEANRKKK